MSEETKTKPMTNGDFIMKYHTGGKSLQWISARMGISADVVSDCIKDMEAEQAAPEESDIQEEFFIETPPTSKDRIEYDIVQACSHLSEASSLLLNISKGIGDALVDEAELLEFVVAKYQESKTDNPYEYLVDQLVAEYVIVKKSK